MKRRRVLAVLGSAGMVSLSGCAVGIELFGDDENGTKNESGLDTPNNPNTEPNDESQTLTESQPTETPENFSKRRSVVETYGRGVGEVNDGIDSRESSVGAWNNDNYQKSMADAQEAGLFFSRAADTFDDAHGLSIEIGNSEAIDICDKSSQRATLLQNAMEEFTSAIDLVQEGRTDRAQDYLDRTKDLENEAERVNVVGTSVLASVLDVD